MPRAHKLEASQEPYYWHEYAPGLVGDAAQITKGTLLPAIAGLGAAFLLILGLGLVLEEGVLTQLLPQWGIDTAAAAGLSVALDQLARMSLLPLAVLCYLAAGVAGVAACMADVAISKKLAGAARCGATRRAVPSPEQVRAVLNEDFSALSRFLWGNVIIVGLIGILMVLVMAVQAVGDGLGDGVADVLLISLGICAYGALMAVPTLWLRRLAPAHQQRRGQIAAHWTPSDERSVWERARSQNQQAQARDFPQGRFLTRTAVVLQLSAFSVGAGAFVLMAVILAATHPQAQRWRGGELGPRGSFSDPVETAVDMLTGTLGAAFGLAVLLGGLGMVLEARSRQIERAMLLRHLADAASARPPAAVVARHANFHGSRTGQLLAASAGVGGALFPAALILSEVQWSSFHGSAAMFGPFAGSAWLGTGACVLLLTLGAVVNAAGHRRGRELRNALMHRWPALPPVVEASEDSPPPAHLLGPALSP